MVRHIKLRHNASASPVKPEGVARDSYIQQGFPSPKLDIDSILSDLSTGTDKSEDPMTELRDWMVNFYTSIKSLGSIHTQPKVSPSVPFHPNQHKNTSPNYWNLPTADIQGISGYFCQSCKIFSLRRIQDLGYDMTEKGKHIRLHGDIDIDIPLDSMAVNSLTNALNFFMPGIKYALSRDLTEVFIYLMINYLPIVVLALIGIPDRWYLYPSEEGLQWLQKIVTHVGKKVRLEDGEVIDFLRRAQASYAIFHIRTETSSRLFAIWITT